MCVVNVVSVVDVVLDVFCNLFVVCVYVWVVIVGGE